MKILYDKKSPLTWPSGRTMTAEEMRASGQYDLLFDYDCVVDTDAEGVSCAYSRLQVEKDAYGITEPDPEKALALVIEAQKAAEEAAKKEAVTLDDLQAQLEEQAAAIEELASIAAGGEQ